MEFRPKLLKGAIAAFDLFNPITSVILFQYNPAMLTRSLKPRGQQEEGASAEAMRLNGPPEETIQIEIEIDATDQLEQAIDTFIEAGIHAKLAALEMLVYPKSALVIANSALAAAGVIEVIPPEAPFTLFIWGTRRILPVRITEMSITEEAFDPRLNPLRAKVSLGMKVLTYNDFAITHPGYYAFLTHQITKEVMAAIGSINDIAAIGSAGAEALRQIL